MKKNLTKLLAVSSLGLLLLPACKKDGGLAVSNGGKAGTLSSSVTALPLDKSKLNDTTSVVTFSFSKANYGYSAAVTYTLQIDVPADNWKSPTSETLAPKVFSQGFSTANFNNLVLKLNVPAGVATPIVVRVQQSLSGSIAPIYSNTLNLSVTAFNLTSWVYVPGAYEGWSNPGPQEDSLLSATGNGVYTGIINFPSGGSQFLILPPNGSTAGIPVGKGLWSYKYATTDNPGTGTTATYSTEYVANGGNNFQVPSAGGYYLVTLNINTNQLTIVPADFYTIIGSAPPGSAWNNDYPMKFINDGTNTWLATGVAMTVGEFKFRQDDQWGSSWGPNGTPNMCTDSSPTGDGNLQITTAGNYNLTFIQPATAVGSGVSPLTTTSYTATPQ